jgi:hypothetical protein
LHQMLLQMHLRYQRYQRVSWNHFESLRFCFLVLWGLWGLEISIYLWTEWGKEIHYGTNSKHCTKGTVERNNFWQYDSPSIGNDMYWNIALWAGEWLNDRALV